MLMHSQGDLLRTLKVHSINLQVLHPGINDVFVEFAKKKKTGNKYLNYSFIQSAGTFPNTRKKLIF